MYLLKILSRGSSSMSENNANSDIINI
jgi:hypothetical protein